MSFFSTRLFVAGALLVTLNACSSDSKQEIPENRVTFNDFESLDGWMPNAPLNAEKAHSGHYSVKVDKDAEFSLSYTNLLGKVSPTKIKKLTVSAWGLRTGGEAKAVIVVEITNPTAPGTKPYWQSMDMYQQIKTFNTWTKVSKEFELPDNILPTSQLRVYMWRLGGGGQPTYLDDFEITKS